MGDVVKGDVFSGGTFFRGDVFQEGGGVVVHGGLSHGM
jgi:hypothetical protein